MSWAGQTAMCAEVEKIYEERPVVASAAAHEAAAQDATAEPLPATAWQGCPVPEWIWGAEYKSPYTLRVEFAGGTKAAWIKASCDNSARLLVNGHEVGRTDDWQSPVEADLQKYVVPGKNMLTAEVQNAGGVAAFCAKILLEMPDGSRRFVVSDSSWRAAEWPAARKFKPVRQVARLGDKPWGDVLAKAGVSGDRSGSEFKVLPGFQVEHLFTVPKDVLGSWVNITLDNRGRIIASDERDKGLCRITPPPIGSNEPTKVEHLAIKTGPAHGMLYAFDSLYLSINGGPGSGLYRARDTNGDDQYDEVVKLASFQGGGEHGPHALRLSPDGKSIYVICGNHTDPPAKIDASRVPTNWGEDLLLPRQWDANGHARGRMAPGGWIAKTDPDGKTWEIISVGYRNAFDMAFNATGELFAYDADMEWDLGSSWYRPTRVLHAVSGSDFGWRSGTGKWPPYYVDSLPPMIEIGPGSPVGVAFGYGAKFPAKYQKALYILDWTFGTIFALHLQPSGATYTATKEEFVARAPLPVTDVLVGRDGALYFTVGGRGTQSELFRVTYTGGESTAPAELGKQAFADQRDLRHQLEAYQHRAAKPAEAVEFAYPHLGHPDRFIRYAARIVLEQQPVELWQARVLAEKNAEALITGAVGLARQGDKSLQGQLLAALDRLEFSSLGQFQQLELLRAYELAFIRMGEPEPATGARIAAKLDAYYPAATDPLNRELSSLLVYLKSPNVIRKTLALIKQPTHSATNIQATSDLLARNAGYGHAVAGVQANAIDPQKMHYVFVLRNLRDGWTPEERQFYFKWMRDSRRFSGGHSFQGFLRNIENEAFDNATDAERLAIEGAGLRKPFQMLELPKPKGPGQNWTLAELLSAGQSGLKGRNYKHGQQMFAAARCIICHRFQGEGGSTGPDLSQLAGRFGLKDMAEAIVDPNKIISDQYRASTVLTSSGKVYTGRILSESKDKVIILTNPEDASKVDEIAKSDIEDIQPSPVSLMPANLINSLNKNEVLDLLAYLLSRGDPKGPMFQGGIKKK
ncbi:MAG TPA: c-type cytochrome [Pirellulales bacterium]|jgi:putative heme-binding domain-containing protein|nr:c-type cytochrome [Pirellulales bacterium]